MLRMAPPPRRRISGMTAWAKSAGAFRLTTKLNCQSASVISRKGPARRRAGVVHKDVDATPGLEVAATAASMSAFRLTSTAIAIASPPLSEMMSARGTRPSSRRLAKSHDDDASALLGEGDDCSTDAAGSAGHADLVFERSHEMTVLDGRKAFYPRSSSRRGALISHSRGLVRPRPARHRDPLPRPRTRRRTRATTRRRRPLPHRRWSPATAGRRSYVAVTRNAAQSRVRAPESRGSSPALRWHGHRWRRPPAAGQTWACGPPGHAASGCGSA